MLFLTDRGERQQKWSLQAAPPALEVIMRRRPSAEELRHYCLKCSSSSPSDLEPVTASMIAAAPQLKMILRLGSLLYDIDVQAAEQAGVRVVSQPVISTIYCAEHAMMMILALVKKLGRGLQAAMTADHGLPAKRTDEDTFSFNWLGFNDIGGLIGKTVAILGMGEIGVELARRLIAFRPAGVLYNKRQPYPAQVERELAVSYADVETCARRADVLVSLLPYSTATDRRVNADVFALMKATALVVHLGSGSVIDEQALASALREHRLAGAALDTYEYEPLQPDNPLVPLARDPNANVLLTPHTAAATLRPDRSGDYQPILDYLAMQGSLH
ncbi:MAG: 2-hydroxyacid dehydrogenase [Anaerolineae bacterium]